MRNMDDIIRDIRTIVLASVNAQKPAKFMYGIVTKTSPLEVQIEQKLTLSEKHLILTRAVRNYETEISISGGSKQPCTVHNALKKGDKVILIRDHGGQKFIVIDKEG